MCCLHLFGQVDNTLYSVYRYPLKQSSVVLASLFSLPQAGADAEGASDAFPIILPGVPRTEFEPLLDSLFPLPWYVYFTLLYFVAGQLIVECLYQGGAYRVYHF
jgi:hypothetical protein